MRDAHPFQKVFRSEGLTERFAVRLVLICSVVPYLNCLLNSFIDDDTWQVLQNSYIRDLQHFREIFTSSVWSFDGHTSNYYRPLMTLGYLVCYKLCGFNPAGFHLVNVFLHPAGTWLLFLVTQRLFRNSMVAIASAMAFALHPVHTEPVAWIAAVPDLELTFFYLLTFLLFLDLGSKAASWISGKYLAMTGSFALALLSKEQSVTLPLLATLYEHFYREDRTRTTRAEKLLRYGPLWLLALAYLPLRARFLGSFAPESRWPDLTLYECFLSSLALIGQYLGKLLWPLHLSAYYVFRKSQSLLDAPVLLGVLSCLAALAMFFLLWKRARLASFGVVWLCVTLVPVLNPRWLGESVFAERYLYLPSVGFCWLIGAGLERVFRRLEQEKWGRVAHVLLYVSLAMLIVLCTVRIVSRNRDWKNNVVYYTRTLADVPGLPLVNELRLNLEGAYASVGDLGGAERELRLMLASEPSNVRVMSDLGAVLMRQARPDDAKLLFLRVIGINPSYSNAHANLGDIYMRAGMLDEAEGELRTATQLKPLYAAAYAYVDLGQIYARKGNRREAERAYKSALSINPVNGDAHLRLGLLYAESGRAEAINEFKAVLGGDPKNAAALDALRRLTAQPLR